jgi:hypothetical protein
MRPASIAVVRMLTVVRRVTIGASQPRIKVLHQSAKCSKAKTNLINDSVRLPICRVDEHMRECNEERRWLMPMTDAGRLQWRDRGAHESTNADVTYVIVLASHVTTASCLERYSTLRFFLKHGIGRHIVTLIF